MSSSLSVASRCLSRGRGNGTRPNEAVASCCASPLGSFSLPRLSTPGGDLCVNWSSTVTSITTQPGICACACPWKVTTPSAAPATEQIIQRVFIAAILRGYSLAVYFVRVVSACDGLRVPSQELSQDFSRSARKVANGSGSGFSPQQLGVGYPQLR